MAEGKKSFVLYCDQKHTIELLPDDIAGRLFKHIFRYVNDENPTSDEILLQVAFEPIKQQLKRDLKDWEGELSIRSNSGMVGNIARWHPDIYKQILNKQLTIEEAILKIKSESSKSSERIKSHPTESDDIANIAVNVNVNDNVTVKDNTTTISDEIGGGEKSDVVVGIKKNNTKEKKSAAPRKKKKGSNPDSEPYWHDIRKKWVLFNKTHLKFNVEPIPSRDYSHMHRIIEKLRERAVGQAVVWTQENALMRWEKFLTVAFTKHDWLPKNFELGNLESKMQSVFNLIDNPNGQHKQKFTKPAAGAVGKTIEFDRP